MIKVLIYNEGQHEKHSDAVKKIYPDGIHNTLKRALEDEEIQIETVTLDNVNDITDEKLKDVDVLIWWGHMHHGDVPDKVAWAVRYAVLCGMGAIFLHSAHHSKPFKFLMGTTGNLGWREDGDRTLLWVVDTAHPIAQGINRFIKLDEEETYSEPFRIPEPDKLVFISNYEGGEVFRSGCCWQRENGKIFYFQPGHETYPIYHNPEIIKVIKNAIHWAKPTCRIPTECPHINKPEL